MVDDTNRPSADAELNLSIVLRALAFYIEDHHGSEKLGQMLAASGLAPSDLQGPTCWGSVEQVEAFYLQAYDLLGRDDRLLMEASGYKLGKSLGPLRYILRALSPRVIYDRTVKDFSIVSKISRQELVELSDQVCIKRYYTTKPESRLFCLSRQGTDAALPTIWGLPKAKVTETACVARGDEYCEYHLSWYRPHLYSRLLIGLACGVTALGVGYVLHPAVVPYLLAVAVAAPLLGHLMDLRVANSKNLDFSDKLTEDARSLLYADAEARQEILELNERQREWDKLATQSRTRAMAQRGTLIEQLAGVQNRFATNVRVCGHDIKSPLTVLNAHSSILRKGGVSIDKAELEEILKYNDEAVDRINDLVRELMTVAKSQKSLKNVVPEEIDVRVLAGQLERRIRALVRGRPIETRVHVQESVPRALRTDRLMLDRILDNLLMHAVQYTSEGRIECLVSSLDAEFSLEVRDTGRGIPPEELSELLEYGGADEASGVTKSFGTGVFAAAELVEQLGGRLVAESEPGKGSSFRVVLRLL